MKLYACGTHVTTKLRKIEGMITGITIRFSAVAYEVKYFFDNDFKTEWMNESEFEVTEVKKQSIGFYK